MTDSPQPRVIKRYANRKLYDMTDSRYVTHDEIARLVERGEEVRIIDNRTKEDLTTRTLTQILFEKERTERRPLPIQTLRGLFQTGGDFIQRRIAQPVSSLRDEAEETVRKVLRRGGAEGEGGGDDVPSGPVDASAGHQPDGASATERPGAGEALREWLDNSQRAVENLQRSLEERWDLVVNTVGHLDINHRRISELEQRIAALEARLEALESQAREEEP